MAGLVIRRARLEDAPAMASIIAAVAPEGSLGAEPPIDLTARAEQYRELISGDGPAAMWVLEQDGALVGHAGVQPRTRGVLSLAMVVLPGARGRGGGRALLDAVSEYARASDAHKIDLEVWVDNAPAIALYASAGFQVEGLRRDHYRRSDGRLRSTLLMAQRVD
jgi:putative acetyltransferase